MAEAVFDAWARLLSSSPNALSTCFPSSSLIIGEFSSQSKDGFVIIIVGAGKLEAGNGRALSLLSLASSNCRCSRLSYCRCRVFGRTAASSVCVYIMSNVTSMFGFMTRYRMMNLWFWCILGALCTERLRLNLCMSVSRVLCLTVCGFC